MASLPPLDVVLRRVVMTGQVVIGSKRTLKYVKLGKVKVVIRAANLPTDLKEDLEYYARLSNVPIIVYPGSNVDLGTVVGKPFSVAMLGVIDSGQVPMDLLLAYARSGSG
ncbi:MAG: 50S ribosomal protein L30e [Crenarchaeota archaeon]|nr:50S ribosomal protein L30e [Thermoproteota archaeon]